MNAGIHDIPAETYHLDELCDVPTLSAGTVKRLALETPLHAWCKHPRLNPGWEPEDGKATFDIGTVAHELILEGTDDSVVVIDADSWRTKDAQEQRDEARAAGKCPLLAKDWERVEAMVTAVRVQLEGWPEDPPLFTDGTAEPTLIWEEPGGVMCRCRPDWLRHDLAAVDDLKTTGRLADALAWNRTAIRRIGADVQVAFYLRGVKNLTGAEPRFRYVLAEQNPPYAIRPVVLESSWVEIGAAKVEKAIAVWRECLKSDRWPAWPQSTYYAEAPAWAEAEFLEHDAEEMTA